MADVPLLKSPVPVSEIGATGTPDATTFLRGDGTWNAAATTRPAKYAIGAGASNHSTTSTAFADIDAVYLLSVPAAAGDILEMELILPWAPSSTNYLRVCANVAGTDSAGGNNGVFSGDSSWTNVATFRTFYVVQAADISGGNVAVKPRWLTNGSTVTAYNDTSLNRRPVFSVKNHGQ